MLSDTRVGNTSEAARSQNLSQLLTAVHRLGPVSRAELTRRSGLNRSTIGSLVSVLSNRGLVQEIDPDLAGRVGRPSPIIAVDPGVAVLAVNPDIDAVTVGVVGLGGQVYARRRRATAGVPTLQEALQLTTEIVADLRPRIARLDRVVGLGLAIPGLVDTAAGRLLIAPHLGWHDADVAGPFGSALDLPTVAANDASLAALAETVFGAAVGADDVVYLNGSASGIGGGIVTGGVQLAGSRGYGAELGHTVVSSGGTWCHCGRSGCLDAEVRLERLLGAAGLQEGGMEALGQMLATDPAPGLLREADRQLELLTVALVNLVNIFDPSLIVLGGFLGSFVDLHGGRLARTVNENSLAGRVVVRRAALGADLLLVGAAELALQPLLTSPS